MAETNTCVYSGSKANAPGPRTGQGRSHAEGGHLVVKKTGIGARWHTIGVGYGSLAAPPGSRNLKNLMDSGAGWTPQDGSCRLGRSIPRPPGSPIGLSPESTPNVAGRPSTMAPHRSRIPAQHCCQGRQTREQEGPNARMHAPGQTPYSARNAGRQTPYTARNAGRQTPYTARNAGRQTPYTARNAGRQTPYLHAMRAGTPRCG
eukprot:gene7964-biopygen18094